MQVWLCPESCRITESREISPTMACATETLLALLLPELLVTSGSPLPSVPSLFSCVSWDKPKLSQVPFLRMLQWRFFGAGSVPAHLGAKPFSTGRAGSPGLLQLPPRLLQQLMRAGTAHALQYLNHVTNTVKSYNLMQP